MEIGRTQNALGTQIQLSAFGSIVVVDSSVMEALERGEESVQVALLRIGAR